MRPDTEPAAAANPTERNEAAEGAAYAHALLARVAAGMGDPRELVALVGFLNGPMLHAACVVIFDALRGLAAQGGMR